MACPGLCSTCSSATVCTSCRQNTDEGQTIYFYQEKSECRLTCPAGTYYSSSYCKPCDISCLQCDKTATNCTACNSAQNYYTNAIGPNSIQCLLDTCPGGKFKNLRQVACEPCSENCQQCTSKDNCSKCVKPYLVYWNTGVCIS